MTAPFGLLTTRRRGRETGANQPVDGKGYFPPWRTLWFLGSSRLSGTAFPASCRTARPAIGGLFCFWGSASFQNGWRETPANHSQAAGVSV